MNDHELDQLIRQTHPDPEFPAAFQREVWDRIALAEKDSWPARWRNWIQAVSRHIARPAPALALFTLMTVIGSCLGVLSASSESETLSFNAYVASIHPAEAARAGARE
ncbi:MAG: hypothetical protein IT576_17725 [Verrucomicrobiales bacterium]|nr:hypothetical protein [Verrucomicrobiales bacterium]